MLNIGNICEFYGESEHSSVLQSIINDKTLHCLFSFIHWELNSGSKQ